MNNAYMAQNPAEAYYKAMFMAAFGTSLFGGIVPEWQIDAVKETASKLKETEIDHSSFSEEEKQVMKHQWKVWLDATIDGFKEELRREGRID